MTRPLIPPARSRLPGWRSGCCAWPTATRPDSPSRLDFDRPHIEKEQIVTAAKKDRIVLAYSGGLDTSVAIGWLANETGAELVAVAADVGQGGEDLDVIRQRALDCGARESA